MGLRYSKDAGGVRYRHVHVRDRRRSCRDGFGLLRVERCAGKKLRSAGRASSNGLNSVFVASVGRDNSQGGSFPIGWGRTRTRSVRNGRTVVASVCKCRMI